MRHREILKGLVAGLRPAITTGDLGKPSIEGTYALLGGAVAGLGRSADSLAVWAGGNQSPARLSCNMLQTGLEKLVGGQEKESERDEQAWWGSFYLTGAQSHVAASLDHMLNAALAHKKGYTLGSRIADDVHMGMWPFSRLSDLKALLRKEGRNQPSQLLLLTRELLEAYGRTVSDSHEVGTWLEKKLAKKYFAGQALETIYESIGNHPEVKLSPAACVIFTVARVNSFKHEIFGLSERATLDVHKVEWAVAAHAVDFLSRFFVAVIEELR